MGVKEPWRTGSGEIRVNRQSGVLVRIFIYGPSSQGVRILGTIGISTFMLHHMSVYCFRQKKLNFDFGEKSILWEKKTGGVGVRQVPVKKASSRRTNPAKTRPGGRKGIETTRGRDRLTKRAEETKSILVSPSTAGKRTNTGNTGTAPEAGVPAEVPLSKRIRRQLASPSQAKTPIFRTRRKMRLWLRRTGSLTKPSVPFRR